MSFLESYEIIGYHDYMQKTQNVLFKFNFVQIMFLSYILLIEYVTERTVLIVDHKNDGLSCKFNRSGICRLNPKMEYSGNR